MFVSYLLMDQKRCIQVRNMCTHSTVFFFKIYFLAVVGLCCCTQAFSSCGKEVLSCGRWDYCSGFSCCRAQALSMWASVVAVCGLSSCGTWIQLLRDTWGPPESGIKLVSLAQQGRLCLGPPVKPSMYYFSQCLYGF